MYCRHDGYYRWECDNCITNFGSEYADTPSYYCGVDRKGCPFPEEEYEEEEKEIEE